MSSSRAQALMVHLILGNGFRNKNNIMVLIMAISRTAPLLHAALRNLYLQFYVLVNPKILNSAILRHNKIPRRIFFTSRKH